LNKENIKHGFTIFNILPLEDMFRRRVEQGLTVAAKLLLK
jgi:hypothetical protein